MYQPAGSAEHLDRSGTPGPVHGIHGFKKTAGSLCVQMIAWDACACPARKWAQLCTWTVATQQVNLLLQRAESRLTAVRHCIRSNLR